VDREQILASLRERILAFAASRIGRDAAEDLAQEVLVVLHEKYPQVLRLEELVPLSFQILRFKMVSLRRKMVRRGEYTQVSVEDVQLPDGNDDPGARLDRKLMSERLAAAVGQLGDRCRELFRLKLEGKSFAEIQTILKVGSINTLYTWDARCRKQLLERMGGSWESGHEG
jgi:RNA polymerase sigma-70 factor (ECF subfamily)